MRWPLVSRSLLEDRFRTHIEVVTAQSEHIRQQERDIAEMRRMYNALLEKYHALAMPKVPTPDPAQIEFEEPDVPPPQVLAAMKQISPVPDKTYEANWQHWERHKEKAAAHPDAFADEILQGAVFEPPATVSILMVPDRLKVT